MTESAKPLEAALYRSYWDDGLLDVLCGLGLLGIGIGWAMHQVVFAAVVPPLLVPVWAPLRRRVIEPRAGYVEFSRTRQNQTARGLWLTFALGVGTFAFGVAAYFLFRGQGPEPNLARLIAGLPAALLAPGAALVAFLTDTRRFHLYGLVLLVAAATTVVLSRGPATPLLAGGLVMVTWGAISLTRFLGASARVQEGG